MIIKKEVKRKKNRFFSFTTFLYFYFFISILAGSILVIAFFQSQFFIQKKDTFLDIFGYHFGYHLGDKIVENRAPEQHQKKELKIDTHFTRFWVHFADHF